jgi:hypothetical protein
VNQAFRFLWPKDWRVIVLAICCATVGFVAAAVLFGAPWHLTPAWGDIPTWLAFIAASVAGGVALTQLSQQQQQITEESVRNVQRDKLLSTQLTEAQERMNAYRRQQAEQVILTSLGVRHNPDGSLGWTGVCEIANDSRRPIRAVTCRMLINGDLIRPTEFRVGEEFRPIIGPQSQAMASLTYQPMRAPSIWALASISISWPSTSSGSPFRYQAATVLRQSSTSYGLPTTLRSASSWIATCTYRLRRMRSGELTGPQACAAQPDSGHPRLVANCCLRCMAI